MSDKTNFLSRKHRPKGYRMLHELICTTDKGARFRYYNWIIWLAKRQVVKLTKGGGYCVHIEAIINSKYHSSSVHTEDEQQ